MGEKMPKVIEISDENYELITQIKNVYELKSMDEAFQLISVWGYAKKRASNKKSR